MHAFSEGNKAIWHSDALCPLKKILNIFWLEIHNSCSNAWLLKLGWEWVDGCGLLLKLCSQHICGTLDFETSQPVMKVL